MFKSQIAVFEEDLYFKIEDAIKNREEWLPEIKKFNIKPKRILTLPAEIVNIVPFKDSPYIDSMLILSICGIKNVYPLDLRPYVEDNFGIKKYSDNSWHILRLLNGKFIKISLTRGENGERLVIFNLEDHIDILNTLHAFYKVKEDQEIEENNLPYYKIS